MMDRTDRLIRICLKCVEKGPVTKSVVTNKLKNYDRESRLRAISALLRYGFVTLSDAPKKAKGVQATLISITDVGRAKLFLLNDQFQSDRTWS